MSGAQQTPSYNQEPLEGIAHQLHTGKKGRPQLAFFGLPVYKACTYTNACSQCPGVFNEDGVQKTQPLEGHSQSGERSWQNWMRRKASELRMQLSRKAGFFLAECEFGDSLGI